MVGEGNVIQKLYDQFSRIFRPVVSVIKKRLFGHNNERLDFIMDSFYKLTSSQQKMVLVAVSTCLFVMVLGAFGFYFSRIHVLESGLNAGFDALHEIRVLSAQLKGEKRTLDDLKEAVSRKMARMRPKAFFEQKANEVGVNLESLRSEEVEISSGSPLERDFMHVNVEFKLPKVSIPRMLKFFREIENSGKNLVVKNLTIRSRYGDRLYFDATAKVVGFKVKRGG